MSKTLVAIGVAFSSLAMAPWAAAVELPSGKGRETLKKTCTQCHDLDSLTQLRQSRAGWQSLVDSMKEMGAEATPAEFKEIVEYLVLNFGAQQAESAKKAAAIPRLVPWEKNRWKVGQALYREHCVVCHDVDVEKSKKLGPSFYHLFQCAKMPRSNVKPNRPYVAAKIRVGGQLMPAFGQKLTPPEIETLLDYMQSK